MIRSTFRLPPAHIIALMLFLLSGAVLDAQGSVRPRGQGGIREVGASTCPPPCEVRYSPQYPTTESVMQFYPPFDPYCQLIWAQWQFGDGDTSDEITPSHQYAADGTYEVTVSVGYIAGSSITCSETITIGPPPPKYAWWNARLKLHWGEIGGAPADYSNYFGVHPDATDGYDRIDSKKGVPPPANYVYGWFSRPDWGQGVIMSDWRSPVPEGTSKRWGPGILDTWNVENGTYWSSHQHSGVFDECFGDREFPIAGSIYITWEFGVCETPPVPLPPDDYAFSLIYRGGINAKPAGTTLPDATYLPGINTTWDMEATPYIVIPLWERLFQPYLPDCSGDAPPDLARFWIVVNNPDTTPTCTVAADPDQPQEAPATFTFTAAATGDEPFTFSWNFGDGASGAGSPVSHTYAVTDIYIVTCTVTDANGDTGTCMCAVDVIPVCDPVCCFTFYPVDPTADDTVRFYDCSTDDCLITSWSWQFGDGGTSTERNPKHVFSTAGIYTVTLTITDYVGASASCQQTVTVTPKSPPDRNTNWNCNLQVYWGCLPAPYACGGMDTGDYFGVRPDATDGYDLFDSKKPAVPMGPIVYAWFERPSWGEGHIMADWRAPILEGASKRWGTRPDDTWNIINEYANADDHSGVFDPCYDDLEYPIAASIYITWEFGISETPPYPLPPDDHSFSLIYAGGINPKPLGTKSPDAMSPPPLNTAWDMEATPYIVIPLWERWFQPFLPDCSGFAEHDVAKFYIMVNNPDSIPTCTVAAEPAGPREVPATFGFTAWACCDEPFTFSWDFGDGAAGTGNPVLHTYQWAGTYSVTCTVTDVDGDAAACSTTVEVTGPRLISLTLAGNCWHRISLPCHPLDPDPWQVFDELRPPNQPLDLLTGCLHRYDHDGRTYVTYWRLAPTGFGPITPGQGYLIWLFDDVTIRYGAQCPDEPQAVSFPTPGWYMMGTPQPTDTYLDDTQWYQGANGPYSFGEIMNLWVQDPLVGWICELGRYYNVGLLPWDEDHYLRAFEGYWFYTFVDDVTLDVPSP